MGEKSAISWTAGPDGTPGSTWNPTTGCSVVSPGCENCYAESLSLRMGWSKKPWAAINAAENVVLHPERLTLPARWKAPRRIFVNSMSDLFHEQVPDEYIDRVMNAMIAADHHTYQVLTKRADRMWRYFHGAIERLKWKQWPVPHIWLGVSVEDQRRADERIPHLLDIRWPIHFLSCEPLLGPVDLRSIHYQGAEPYLLNVLSGRYRAAHDVTGDGLLFSFGLGKLGRINWVIDGGESGPGFRPANPDWYRSLRDQCAAAGVPYFHKQDSGRRPGTGVELDGQVWHQFPEARQ